MDVRQVLVIGAGTMGHGIAHVAAQTGYRVRLFDVDAKVLERKREALAWRPQNGFLKDEQDERLLLDERTDRAA